MNDGLLITHEGKRYFLRPEVLTLCRVSDSDLAEMQKHGPLPEAAIVPLKARTELSIDELSHAVGGLTSVGLKETSTVMCPW